MALHFALRDKKDDSWNARAYVLESYRLSEKLKSLPDIRLFEQQWKAYVAKHPSYDLDEDDWEDGYLPADEDDNTELPMPPPSVVLDFPHITRRIAAQRSRFIVFGTDPACLSEEFKRADSTIKVIEIAAEKRPTIRQELRDCGVTESVIYPDLDGLGREMRQLWDARRAAAEENS